MYTQAQRYKIMDEILDKATLKFMGYLRGRWESEKAFESFDQYLAAAKRHFERNKNVKLLSGKKRPFSFEICVKGFPYNVLIILTHSSIEWKSVPVQFPILVRS